MPRVHVFANGVRSCGEGFIKTPSSGMWQCTLMPDAPPLETRRDDATTAATGAEGDGDDVELHVNSSTPPCSVDTPTVGTTTSTVAAQWIQQQKKKQHEELAHRHLQPQSPPSSQKFQLISSSSRYLCSVLIVFRQHLLSEVQIIHLQRIPQKIHLPDNVGVAFASATEATWADVISFLLQHRSPTAVSIEVSHTAVWQLEWSAPMDCSMHVGTTFLWRITGLLPLCGRVQDAFMGDDALCVALNSVKGGVPHTPPNRVIPKPTVPPPLQPKLSHPHESMGELPQRDLSVEFEEARERNDGAPVVTATVGRGDDDDDDEGTNARKEAAEEGGVGTGGNAVRQPTYAEALLMGMQRHGGRCRIRSPEECIRDWRRRLIALKLELRPGSASADAMLRMARERLLLQQQPRRAAGVGGRMDVFLLASLKELICGVQFDVAARRVVYGRVPRGVGLLMRECIDVACVVGDEVSDWTGGAVTLPFPQCVLQLRLLRHRCCATVLLGQTVGPKLLHEMLRVGKRLLTLLPTFPHEGCRSDYNDSDTAVGQLASGILTAALSLLEVSVLARNGEGGAMWKELRCSAGTLLLWIRNASGGIVAIPASLVAQLEDGAAGNSRRMGTLLQRCTEDCTALPRLDGVSRSGELCCGLVRAVPCGAAFDQQFASSLALFARIETAAAGGGGGAAQNS